MASKIVVHNLRAASHPMARATSATVKPDRDHWFGGVEKKAKRKRRDGECQGTVELRLLFGRNMEKMVPTVVDFGTTQLGMVDPPPPEDVCSIQSPLKLGGSTL